MTEAVSGEGRRAAASGNRETKAALRVTHSLFVAPSSSEHHSSRHGERVPPEAAHIPRCRRTCSTRGCGRKARSQWTRNYRVSTIFVLFYGILLFLCKRAHCVAIRQKRKHWLHFYIDICQNYFHLNCHLFKSLNVRPIFVNQVKLIRPDSGFSRGRRQCRRVRRFVDRVGRCRDWPNRSPGRPQFRIRE